MPLDQTNLTLLVIVAVLVAAMIGLIVLCNARRKKLNSEASTDPLTGGLAERFFLLRANGTLKGKENSFALVSMQVNNMTAICVSFGPSEQNATLKRLHDALETQLGSEELFVRTGEDSFSFLLKNRKSDDAKKDGADCYSLDLCFGIYLP